MQSAVDIDLEVDHDAGLGGRLGQAASSFFAVAVHCDSLGIAGQLGDALPLRLADDRICNADIVDACSRKWFGFAYLGADDPDRASRDLRPGNLGNFMRLDVRPELHSAPVDARLPLADVSFQAIKIDERGGRVQIVDG